MPRTAHVTYVDRLPEPVLRSHYPELSSEAFAPVEVLGTAEDLSAFRDGTIDFVIANAENAAAGFGIANERKWGYGLGIVMAILPFGLRLMWGQSLLGASIVNLMFEIALVALLLHPQSRDYQRIWFK